MKRYSLLKKTATVIAAAALSVFFGIAAFAAEGRINFSDPTVTSGSEVSVTMKVTADPGTSLDVANIMLVYPKDKLEFVAGTDADGGAGRIRVHGASNGKGTNVLEYNLRFNTSPAGTYRITIDTYEVYDSEGSAVAITHQGNSAVTVTPAANASVNAALKGLEVSPGELSPAFSGEVLEYSVKVGASVDKLTISAVPEDEAASVLVQDNEGFETGMNTVLVNVTAGDGTTSKQYVLNVEKAEASEEPATGAAAETQAVEGVQLYSKNKSITIMNPAAGVSMPEGFRESTISIDKQKVRGWVWGADQNPEYCVVYGMNDTGETNFYRYDLKEKTIQRFFVDPLAVDSVPASEFRELTDEYNELNQSFELRFLIICILAIIAFILLMLVIYLAARLHTVSKDLSRSIERFRRTGGRPEEDVRTDEPESGKELLKHNYTPVQEPQDQEAADETHVIRRPEPRKRGRAYGKPADAVYTKAVRITEEEEPQEPEEKEDPGIETFDI